MKATTQSIEGSHVAIISKAYEVAEFITLALVHGTLKSVGSGSVDGRHDAG